MALSRVDFLAVGSDHGDRLADGHLEADVVHDVLSGVPGRERLDAEDRAGTHATPRSPRYADHVRLTHHVAGAAVGDECAEVQHQDPLSQAHDRLHHVLYPDHRDSEPARAAARCRWTPPARCR